MLRIDAIDGGGNDAFHFGGSATHFDNTAGELIFHQTASSTIVEGDTNGDGKADFQIALTGVIDLTVVDFVL